MIDLASAENKQPNRSHRSRLLIGVPRRFAVRHAWMPPTWIGNVINGTVPWAVLLPTYNSRREIIDVPDVFFGTYMVRSALNPRIVGH